MSQVTLWPNFILTNSNSRGRYLNTYVSAPEWQNFSQPPQKSWLMLISESKVKCWLFLPWKEHKTARRNSRLENSPKKAGKIRGRACVGNYCPYQVMWISQQVWRRREQTRVWLAFNLSISAISFTLLTRSCWPKNTKTKKKLFTTWA